MRVLIYVEPALFRADPLTYGSHIRCWVEPLLLCFRHARIEVALATSTALLNLISPGQAPRLCRFAIPSWSILAGCGYRRELYSQALFDGAAAEQAVAGQGLLAPLAAELQTVNAAFQPDVVLATGQNSLLPLVFHQARCLWMEQPLFPRVKRRDRVYLDPCGHQLGSVLERGAELILHQAEVNPALWPDAMTLWKQMQAPRLRQQWRARRVRHAVRELATERQVVLLVLQPPDSISWEGCMGGAIAQEALLAQWAAELPPGWVGIPLYKSYARLPAALEASLGEAFPQLAFLPPELNGNVGEWALPAADAVVAVSSSLAGQALLWGKQAVVVGRTPLRHLASTSLEALAHPGPTLSVQQRLNLLAFLSHRYTFTLAEIRDPTGPFREHFRALVEAADPLAWLLDLSGWTPKQLARLV
jgi:hypothetical protein